MKLPTYWSKATVEKPDADGRKVTASCWRWSDQSKEDAHNSALEAAKQMVHRLIRGERPRRYSYGERPLREEVIQTFLNEQGELSVAVTRNSYGVQVLNTAQAMFIDLDLAPITIREKLRYFFSRLLGRKRPSPEAQREADVDTKLDNFLQAHLDWAVRVYRTCAGVRVLVTHSLFDPAVDSTRLLLESLGTDPLYVRLCRSQECFRARLTPKPWRCGHTANRVVWPHESDEQQSRFGRWLAEYEEKQSGYATCRFLRQLGVKAVHPDVEPIIRVHDQLTRCSERLPLA